jgi:ribosomal protein L11 methyltransferase
MKFLIVQVHDVPGDFEDLLTELAFAHGASGVAEDLSFEQTSREYEPEIIDQETHLINIYFETVPDEEFFLRLSTLLPNSQVTKSLEENRDWLEEWKKGFEPFALAEPYRIVPSWCQPP